ncbi:MAG: hypothetical protein ABSF03_21665 [Streptosporangiaceae bacterium]
MTPTTRAHTTPRPSGLVSEAGTPRHQARAHSGLARIWHAGGDQLQAQRHWQAALTHYVALGAPEAREIRAHLVLAGNDGGNGHEPTEQKWNGGSSLTTRSGLFRPAPRAPVRPPGEAAERPRDVVVAGMLALLRPGSYAHFEAARLCAQHRDA